jgi:tetratricopeptide (TPR) repeat protein
LLELDSVKANPADVAMVLLAAGSWQAERSSFSDALKSFEGALAIYKKLGDSVGIATSASNIGAVHLEVGDRAVALDHCSRALTMFNAEGNPAAEAVCLHNLGNAYDATGDTEKALGCYREALVCSREASEPISEARILIKIGRALGRQDEKKQAEHFIRQAATICRLHEDRFGEAEAIHYLACIIEDGDDDTCELLQQALAIRREIGDLAGEVRSLSELRDTLAEEGQTSVAITRGKQAVNVWHAVMSENRELHASLKAALLAGCEREVRVLSELLRRVGQNGEAEVLDRRVAGMSHHTYTRESPATGPPINFAPDEQQWLRRHDAYGGAAKGRQAG